MSAPRVTPGTRADIGRVNASIARLLGAATGGPPPNIFTTLARHRRLFRPWLRFAGSLMPGGLLPREDTEVLILRVAHNCGCEYEWHHHERLGAEAGLTAEEIERVRSGPGAAGWSRRREVLLRAADELHGQRTISDPGWSSLRELGLSDAELIEVCMLVGHYEMLAMTLNALAVQPDPAPLGSRSPFMRVAQSVARRRSGTGRPS